MFNLTARDRLAMTTGSILLLLIALQYLLGIAAPSNIAALINGRIWLNVDILGLIASTGVLAYVGCAGPALKSAPAPVAAEPNAVEKFRMIRRDPLTGLANRRMFDDLAGEHLMIDEPCAVLLLDLDGFKRLNDQFGFRFGDALLQQVGDRLRATVANANFVAHLFSDEFAILAPGQPASEDADALALHLLRALETPFSHDGVSVQVSASIGIAKAPIHGRHVTSLMQAATHALRAAKNAGRGAWRVYNTTMQDSNAALRDELPAAIANGQIVPYYQPIVDLESRNMVGLEVLARWHHPTRGVLTPEDFIDLAETEGQLCNITVSLLQQVARDSAHWPEALSFAFNIVPNQLRDLVTFALTQPDLPTLPCHRIEVELTENALIQDLEATREAVAVLHSRGVRVVLDDFGAGHGNFHHLRGIPFDRIKIDKEFVVDVLTDRRAEICVRSIVEASRMLGIDVTAEGVATPEIAARVNALGCRLVQGSLFSMPVPPEAVPGLITRFGATTRRAEVRDCPFGLQCIEPQDRLAAD
jgi:diguanylate cyclase (GGDEF)-like protein